LNDDDGFGIFSNNTDIIVTSGDSHSVQINAPLIKLLCDNLDLRECGAIACDNLTCDNQVECATLRCENLILTGSAEIVCDNLTCDNQVECATLRCESLTLTGSAEIACDIENTLSISATKVVVESPQVQIAAGTSFSIECSAPIAIPPAVSSGCVVHNANIGCYFFSNMDNDWHAVLCSRLNLGTTYRRTDLYWWIGPGFKIILFGSANYQDPVHQSIDNTNGAAPIFETPLHPADCVAVKVLYRGATINFEPLSIFFP
jgi:hypothetical protein